MNRHVRYILVAVALVVVLGAVPAYAGQSAAAPQGAQNQTAQGRDSTMTPPATQTQTRASAGECDGGECDGTCEQPQTRTRVRNEVRVGENEDPPGDGRIRDRDRIGEADAPDDSTEPTDSVEPTDTIEPTSTPEPTETVEPVEGDVSASLAQEITDIVPGMLRDWINTVLGWIGAV